MFSEKVKLGVCDIDCRTYQCIGNREVHGTGFKWSPRCVCGNNRERFSSVPMNPYRRLSNGTCVHVEAKECVAEYQPSKSLHSIMFHNLYFYVYIFLIFFQNDVRLLVQYIRSMHRVNQPVMARSIVRRRDPLVFARRTNWHQVLILLGLQVYIQRSFVTVKKVVQKRFCGRSSDYIQLKMHNVRIKNNKQDLTLKFSFVFQV